LKSITVIRNEHQAMAAMLHALLSLVRGIREHRLRPNFELLGAMIYYVDTFPERLHHPKEDQWLFRLLGQRHPPAQALIDRLQAEHRLGASRIRQLEQTLSRYREGGDTEFPAFAAVVEAFVEFERNHMRSEEMEILPLAREHLLPADWAEIDAAFATNADPLIGVSSQDQFDDLFSRIVNLAPAPIGVGPASN
jgi:branched-chain amino acid transport system ATP-binding protein